MTLLVACGLKREAAIIARAGRVVIAGGGDAAWLERELEAAVAGATAVLSCGVAGALDPALKAGDVVVGSLSLGPLSGGGRGPVVHGQPATDVSKSEPSQPGPGLRRRGDLIESLRKHLPEARHGSIVGADTIIASVAEKAALHAATGALAVDMESHIAARVAMRHGLPFAILRTISDAAYHALPPAALVGMRPDGGLAFGAVLASLARNPAQLPALIRTGRDAGLAFAALRRALSPLIPLGIGEFDPLQFGLDMR